MSEKKKETKIKPKHKLFADFYIGEALFNGTKAAQLAGYQGNNATLAVTASKTLKIREVKDYIETQLADLAMGANEVIARLGEIAKGDVTDLLDDKGNFDLKLARERNKTFLIKKMKRKRTIRQKKTEIADSMQTYLAEDEINDLETETEIIYEETEFEMYSAHEALRDLGKHHKLFTEKQEIEQTVSLSDELASSLEKALSKAYGDET